MKWHWEINYCIIVTSKFLDTVEIFNITDIQFNCINQLIYLYRRSAFLNRRDLETFLNIRNLQIPPWITQNKLLNLVCKTRFWTEVIVKSILCFWVEKLLGQYINFFLIWTVNWKLTFYWDLKPKRLRNTAVDHFGPTQM